jgi:AraC-like DNA-binding protein
MHWHNEFEINFILQGSAEFTCEDKKFISNKGDIIITQPNLMHSIYPYNNITQVYDTLVFSPDIFGINESDRYMHECIQPLVKGDIRVPMHITPKHPYYNDFRTIVENIFSCAKGDSPQLDMLMRSEIIRLFWLLETESENFSKHYEQNENIRMALEYISNNFKEKITIQQLSDTVHLSPSYFMSQFQKCVGVSTGEYISQFRINQACKMIIDTHKNISEIAFDCGFYNISNFNRQFYKIVGCSPTQYKKKIRSKC